MEEPYYMGHIKKRGKKANRRKGYRRRKIGGKGKTTKFSRVDNWNDKRGERTFFFKKNENYEEDNDNPDPSAPKLSNFQYGVTYSVNKGRNWELVKKLQKDGSGKLVMEDEREKGMYISSLSNPASGMLVEKKPGKKKKYIDFDHLQREKKNYENGLDEKKLKEDEPTKDGKNLTKSKKKISNKEKRRKNREKNRKVKPSRRSKAPRKTRVKSNDDKSKMYELSMRHYDLITQNEDLLFVQSDDKPRYDDHKHNRGYSPEWRMGIEKHHTEKKRRRLKNDIKDVINQRGVGKKLRKY